MIKYISAPYLSPDTKILASLEEAMSRVENIVERINAYSQSFMDKGDVSYEKNYMIEEQNVITQLATNYYKELNGLDDVSANNVEMWLNEVNTIINNRVHELDSKLIENFSLDNNLFSIFGYDITSKHILIIILIILVLFFLCSKVDTSSNLQSNIEDVILKKL